MLVIVFGILFAGLVSAQVQDRQKNLIEKEKTLPRAFDFSRYIQESQPTRTDYEEWFRKREDRLRERYYRVDALELALEPERYRVGPGDEFSFHVMDMGQEIPVLVSADGKLVIPSVGEFDVAGKPLLQVRETVMQKADSVYQGSDVSFSLTALRFFRVHVTGEVQYPGTYVAQAVDRISELITEAGGVTEWAWKNRIELKHPDGSVSYYNLSSYEQDGRLEENPFVEGGDVIHVPSMDARLPMVRLGGDLENAGVYQIVQGEPLFDFLERIRALKRNTDITKIMVIRGSQGRSEQFLFPYRDAGKAGDPLVLQDGDRIIMPSSYVYVKGSVRVPGPYPYIADLRARDYAGMAGGDYRSDQIKAVQVFHTSSGKTEKGPDALVEPGDMVLLKPDPTQRVDIYLRIISTVTSLLIAAKAVGLF